MGNNVNPIPKHIAVRRRTWSIRDATQAINFCTRAFGALEMMQLRQSDGKVGHAELRIGDAPIMLADEFSGHQFPQSGVDWRYIRQHHLRRRMKSNFLSSTAS